MDAPALLLRGWAVVRDGAVYLAIGALFHVAFAGPRFAADSLLSWGLLLAWPAVPILAIYAALLAIVLLAGIAALLAVTWEACRG